MGNIKAIFLKELRGYFNSAVGYIVLVVFLAISGWFFAQGLFRINQASIMGFSSLVPLLFLFMIPGLSMRLIAEEEKTGTMELLATLPLKDHEIILGKWLAALALVAIGILITLIYPITASFLGNLDWGEVLSSYIGMLLLAAFFCSIGIFTSSITKSQVVAFVGALVICFFFFILGKILPIVAAPFVSLVEYIGIDYHYNSITKGVLDTRNIIYFLSLAFFFLLFAFYFLRRARYRMMRGISILTILGIIILINFFSYRIFWRADLTQGNIYSLSKASVKLTRGLEDPVVIRAYVTANLPYPYNNRAKYVKDLLSEYRLRSKGRVKFELVNPSSREKMMEARRAGIYPLQFSEQKTGEYGIKEGYMGMVFLYEDKKEVMPVIENLSNLEYDVTSKIKKLTQERQKTIGLIKGHDEVSLDNAIIQKIREQYMTKEINVENEDIPSDMTSICVLGPKKIFSKEGCEKIEKFLSSGGAAEFFIDKEAVNLDFFMATELKHPYLDTLLSKYDIKIRDGLVMDEQNAKIGLTTRRGFFTMTTPVAYPFFPRVSKFTTQNPIVRGLSGLAFPYVSPIEGGTPIARSSKNSWLREKPQSLNPMNKQKFFPFALPYEKKGPFTLATSLLNPRMVVCGTSRLVEKRFASQEGFTFFLNSLDWLTQDEQLISIRSKGIADRPLKKISPGKKSALKYMNTILPSLVLLAVGFLRWRKRRKEEV
jgi:ABC-type uncharacterized transport system involved in gliding motility auxiliary subunit/ABC-type multidrug transport system permease subunit